MHVYLVTFHLINGRSFETILNGFNLDDVKKQVKLVLFDGKDQLAHFSLKDSKDVFFTVVYENIASVEYELLSIEPKIYFDDISKINEDELKNILSYIHNEFILAVSLVTSDKIFRDKIMKSLSEEKRDAIDNITKIGLGRITMKDVEEARLKIINELISLEEKGIFVAELIENYNS